MAFSKLNPLRCIYIEISKNYKIYQDINLKKSLLILDHVAGGMKADIFT